MPVDRIDPLAPVPPYRQIANILKRQIISGQYPANSRIPTESELVEAYEVARTTARRAARSSSGGSAKRPPASAIVAFARLMR